MLIAGIDLGSSNTCAAVMRGGDRQIILPADAPKDRVTPTIVSYTDKGTPAVGRAAKMQAQTNPQFTFFGVKRLLGRRFDDEMVQAMVDLVPFDIAPGPNGEAYLQGRDRLYSPEEVLSEVLKKSRLDIEAATGEPSTHCVITVPARASREQEAATVMAARMAGLTAVRVEKEPTAAAVAYAFHKQIGRTIAVFDFGGGTFDVTILRVRKNGMDPLASRGDPFLGGLDFDTRIVADLLARIEATTGVDAARTDRFALQRLHEAAEAAKESLSVVEEHRIQLQNIVQHPETKQMLHFDGVLTKTELEELTRDLIDRVIEPCEEAMRDAGIEPGDIDEVVMIGGMCGMPAIKQMVEELFGRPGRQDIAPDAAVAFGAALIGASVQGDVKSLQVNERLQHSIGFADADGTFVKLLKSNTTLGREVAKLVTTNEDNQTAVWVEFREGERDVTSDNRLLARMILEGIPPLPAGEPQIRVSAVVDRDGVCTMKATEQDTGVEIVRRIHTASGLTREELDELRASQDEAA